MFPFEGLKKGSAKISFLFVSLKTKSAKRILHIAE
jgi:hypothetical protein